MKKYVRGGDKNTQLEETGSIKKKWKDKLPVALVFPNSYQLGMSNLGFQLIYKILNSYDEIVCERVFLPIDSKPLSIESNRPLADFPVILFSISFELDFPNLISILDMAGLEPLAQDRPNDKKIQSTNPLIIAGGVATFINPEPLAPFFDFFVLGEAESVLPEILTILLDKHAQLAKGSLLEDIAQKVPGCYVPAYYEPSYNDDGTFHSFSVLNGFPEKIKKIRTEEQPEAGHSAILTPNTEFSNIFLTELGRGCSRGCRFCAAGFVYRPPRLWSSDSIIKAIDLRPEGASRVGLLGMEMVNPADLENITKYLLKESCALSFSSLRADMINPQLLQLLERSALKSAAIAPDGGSERLRRVISKNITEKDIFSAAESLVRAGVKNLKLYYMIGLPTENEEDLAEMVRLIREIHERVTEIGRARGHLSDIFLSINSFVPKAWTPFQYCSFRPVKELKGKIKYIRKKLAGIANLRITVDNPEKAFFQAVMARGDRKVGRALLEISRQERNWRQVLVEENIDPGFYAMRDRERDEVFPWEIIDHGIKKSYLWKEYQMSLKSESSKGCGIAGPTKCKRCGVCND